MKCKRKWEVVILRFKFPNHDKCTKYLYNAPLEVSLQNHATKYPIQAVSKSDSTMHANSRMQVALKKVPFFDKYLNVSGVQSKLV